MKMVPIEERFAEAVENGSKRSAVLKLRPKPFEVGDEIRMHAKKEGKKRRTLLEGTCTQARDISVKKNGTVRMGSLSLTNIAAYELAKSVGFARHVDLLRWLDDTYGLPFAGQIIRW